MPKFSKKTNFVNQQKSDETTKILKAKATTFTLIQVIVVVVFEKITEVFFGNYDWKTADLDNLRIEVSVLKDNNFNTIKENLADNNNTQLNETITGKQFFYKKGNKFEANKNNAIIRINDLNLKKSLDKQFGVENLTKKILTVLFKNNTLGLCPISNYTKGRTSIDIVKVLLQKEVGKIYFEDSLICEIHKICENIQNFSLKNQIDIENEIQQALTEFLLAERLQKDYHEINFFKIKNFKNSKDELNELFIKKFEILRKSKDFNHINVNMRKKLGGDNKLYKLLKENTAFMVKNFIEYFSKTTPNKSRRIVNKLNATTYTITNKEYQATTITEENAMVQDHNQLKEDHINANTINVLGYDLSNQGCQSNLGNLKINYNNEPEMKYKHYNNENSLPNKLIRLEVFDGCSVRKYVNINVIELSALVNLTHIIITNTL